MIRIATLYADLAGSMEELRREHPAVGDYPQRLYRTLY